LLAINYFEFLPQVYLIVIIVQLLAIAQKGRDF